MGNFISHGKSGTLWHKRIGSLEFASDVQLSLVLSSSIPFLLVLFSFGFQLVFYINVFKINSPSILHNETPNIIAKKHNILNNELKTRAKTRLVDNVLQLIIPTLDLIQFEIFTLKISFYTYN